MKETPPAGDETSHRRGGWGWLLVPSLLMVLGSNVVFGAFMLRFKDVTVAGPATFSVGPVTWSVLHLILIWIALRRLRASRISLRDIIGFERERLLSDLGLGVAIAAAGTAVVLLSLRALEPLFGAGAPPFPIWAIVWWTLVTSVTAGVGEEIYFRGFLFKRLDRLSRPVLLLVTSLAFAVWHLSPVMLLHTFLIGLVLGWIYLRTKRLFPVILGHILVDVVGGIWMLTG